MYTHGDAELPARGTGLSAMLSDITRPKIRASPEISPYGVKISLYGKASHGVLV